MDARQRPPALSTEYRGDQTMSSTVTPSAARDTATATSSVTTWQVDPTHTSVGFAVKHLVIATVKGQFGSVTGAITVDERNPRDARVEVEIDAKSIDTRTEQRDAHLRSPDFLDVEKFPTIRFASKRIEGDVAGDFRLIGDLTIRGTTRETVLEVTNEGRARDPWGNERAVFSAKTKINRAEFGLTWNQALETGGVLVGEDVKISIDVELVKAAQA
jgi:polyisoprenoid-binding protein YceI